MFRGRQYPVVLVAVAIFVSSSGLSSAWALGCGDGVVDAGETCDDGRQCTDGTDCTSDAGVCAGIGDGSCGPRDGGCCNAICQLCRNINYPNAYCDPVTTQCVNSAPNCPLVPYHGSGSVNRCGTPVGGPDPVTGLCIYVPPVCPARGCNLEQCDPADGICKVLTNNVLACGSTGGICVNLDSDGTPCDVGACSYEHCRRNPLQPQNCDRIEVVDCAALNPSTCQTTSACTLPAGCEYHSVVCAPPSDPCAEELVYDHEAPGCCTYRAKDCAGEFGNNPDFTYSCTAQGSVGVCHATPKPPPFCGDGAITAGEVCDDGNTVAGDGCTACQVDPCYACSGAPSICQGAVPAGCSVPLTPARTMLEMRNVGDAKRDLLEHRLRTGSALDPLTFGDPRATSAYRVCLFDTSLANPKVLFSGDVAAGGTCGTRPCWAAARNGFRFRTATPNAAGLRRLELVGGADGDSRVAFKAVGPNLSNRPGALPGLPLPVPMTLTVQRLDGPACFRSDYPATGVRRNDAAAGRFSATGG